MSAFLDMNSPIGPLRIGSEEAGITTLAFINTSPESTKNPSALLLEAKQQLEDYFKGDRKTFDLPLVPKGTDFQKEVWQVLAQIPYGTTKSYLWMAKQLGDPKKIRAAASANGKNPLPIFIPCHRVIGSDGSLVGYRGGLEIKEQLLRLEGAISQLSLLS